MSTDCLAATPAGPGGQGPGLYAIDLASNAIRRLALPEQEAATLEGLDGGHRLEIQFDNVIFDDPDRIKISATKADVKAGPGPFNRRGVCGMH